MTKKKKPVQDTGDGLFKSVMLAYVVLVLHVLLMLGLGLLVIFFRGIIQYMLWIFLLGAVAIAVSGAFFYRRMKSQGKTLKEMVSSPMFDGRPVEVSLLGGMASFRIGQPGGPHELESKLAHPNYQLEDPETVRIRELTQLADLLEKNLITREEYNQAKKTLFKPTGGMP